MTLSLSKAISLAHESSRYFSGRATLYQGKPRFEFIVNHYLIDIQLDVDGTISVSCSGSLWGTLPLDTKLTREEEICIVLQNRLRTVIGLACLRAHNENIRNNQGWV